MTMVFWPCCLPVCLSKPGQSQITMEMKFRPNECCSLSELGAVETGTHLYIARHSAVAADHPSFSFDPYVAIAGRFTRI
ncbi:hypothetical protein FB451DRAFT_1220636 [Mycena latifolia]|nr:hypothetical protein FB451DRAFT_1220636 [Mycena latifolia]